MQLFTFFVSFIYLFLLNIMNIYRNFCKYEHMYLWNVSCLNTAEDKCLYGKIKDTKILYKENSFA